MTYSIYLFDTVLATKTSISSISQTFMRAFLLQITQTSNLSNLLACLLVPVMPEIEIPRLTLTNQVVPDVTSLLDRRCQT